MPVKHAFLSASASHRWLECPPSAKLCAEQDDRASPYATQGTDAHALCEYKVLKALGRPAKDPTEDLDFFDTEMDNYTDEYCTYVMEQLQESGQYCKDPEVLVEQRLDFSDGYQTASEPVTASSLLIRSFTSSISNTASESSWILRIALR